MPKLKKSKFRKVRTRPPYDKAGRSNFRFTLARAGVYIIRENGKVVYIGFSATNLYKTMHRHFQQWNHRGQPVVTYVNKFRRNKYTVSVTLTGARTAALLETALIRKYKPRDNPGKIEFALSKPEKKIANDWIKEKTIADKDLPF